MSCPFCIICCRVCKKLLVANNNNFAKKKGGKHGLSTMCKKCRSDYHKQHKDHDNKRNAKYYENNKDQILNRQKEYKQNNLEKVREQNRIKNKRYRTRHPEVAFNVATKRRLKEDSQGSGLTHEQFLDMMNWWNWSCAYSGHIFSSHNKDKDRTIDHIIPINNNGVHEVWNMVPMYANYNYSKQDRNLLEWYKEQSFYSEERLNKIYEWCKYAKNKYDK
jgi:5-methylcytosine-specific restriction endonuclease McrA